MKYVDKYCNVYFCNSRNGYSVVFLVCLYKQHKNFEKSEYIELFPEKDIYIKNAYEGERFNISDEERINSERLAATQRGSVRIACGVYFTTTEYEKNREEILAIKLP